MWSALPSLSSLTFEKEYAILRNFGQVEVLMYDTFFVPIVRVLHGKLLILITMSENQSHIFWLKVADSFFAHGQDEVVVFLRPYAGLEKQDGQ